MAPEHDHSQLDELRELLDRSEMGEIRFHELFAQLDEENDGTENVSPADVDLGFQVGRRDQGFGIRAKAFLTSEVGTARVVVSADYSLDPGPAPNDELLQLFAAEIALRALFPYLREAIQDLTLKVFGEPLTLPILHRGELEVSERPAVEGL